MCESLSLMLTRLLLSVIPPWISLVKSLGLRFRYLITSSCLPLEHLDNLPLPNKIRLAQGILFRKTPLSADPLYVIGFATLTTRLGPVSTANLLKTRPLFGHVLFVRLSPRSIVLVAPLLALLGGLASSGWTSPYEMPVPRMEPNSPVVPEDPIVSPLQ